MRRIFIANFFVMVSLLGLFVSAASAQQTVPIEVEPLTVKPVDSVDAERVRVWIPVEIAYSCLVKVSILDSLGHEVTPFLNTILGRGYYNFYWNKKDSLGQFVPAGKYTYTGRACSRVLNGKLEVIYHEWEKGVEITVHDSLRPPEFILSLPRDSAKVSVTTYFGRGRMADEIVKDTLLMKGEHHFIWQPKINLPPGNYRLSCTVGDFQYDVDFKYQP